MKLIKNENGYSFIETAIVMMLLLLFSLGIFLLAATTSTTYESLVEDKTETEELRIASSYIVTKLRQNDRLDSVTVDYKTLEFSEALVISETITDEIYETWIYLDQGTLRELTLLKDEPLNLDMSFEIAKVDTLKMNVDKKSIVFSLSKGETSLSDVFVTLKSNVELVK